MKRFLLLTPFMFASPAMAQIDSREGIALQNQIYELRQELQQVQQQGPGPIPAAAFPSASAIVRRSFR